MRRAWGATEGPPRPAVGRGEEESRVTSQCFRGVCVRRWEQGRKKACPVAPWVSEITPASDARVEDARPYPLLLGFCLFVCGLLFRFSF